MFALLGSLGGGRAFCGRVPAVSSARATSKKAVFFDMQHSNNAARIRLWLAHKPEVAAEVATNMITYPDLQSAEFAAVNPLKKVPALIRADGHTVFESQVILEYLEDKYSGVGQSFKPDTPEGRQTMNLLIRIHDLYIASPNCTQPGFSHTQGAMYLSPYETPWTPAVRCMDRPTRAAKIAEIWKQLKWLDANIGSSNAMVGDKLSLADFTWFPTFIFMEFMLPRVFNWPDVLNEPDHLPHISAWFVSMRSRPEFEGVRGQIWSFWEGKEKEGQFESIRGETLDTSYKWQYP